jgi:nanoRNase/pAp phosphatase (c-di-AMP/oligoRNAs hydrolase)
MDERNKVQVNMEPLVIYHGGCRDGFCAAWAVHEAEPSADFFEGFHGQEPPDCAGRDVVMVDFSYPPDVLKRVADQCASLLVLDHHKTAQAALESFVHPRATIVFDMERSGAGMAWDYFNEERERPWIVDYVEDRDLWKNALPHSTSVSAYIGTLEYKFQKWSEASQLEHGHRDAAEFGSAVEAKVRQYIREVSKNAILVDFEGHNIPMVNAPQVDISELLNFLAHGKTFSMGWWQRGDGIFSYGLRSIGDFDVSEIAKRHGGGGHRNAAGFQLDEPLRLGASAMRQTKEHQ